MYLGRDGTQSPNTRSGFLLAGNNKRLQRVNVLQADSGLYYIHNTYPII